MSKTQLPYDAQTPSRPTPSAPDGPAPSAPDRPAPPVALYLHLPFCIARCPYCDFVVYAGANSRGPRARTERLYAAVDRELELRADALDRQFGRERPPLASVYFGGGTPSLVSREWLERLMATIRARYGVAPGAEVTLEANPGPDERGDLADFVRAGVTRLSLGAQSLDAGELRRIGRRHSPADVAAALAAAREAAIASVNLDLLYDVPGQSLGAWRGTLDAALELAPDHLSLYALTLDDPDAEGLTGLGGDHLPTTPGARRWRERARAEQDDDRAAEQYEFATAMLAGAGWRGYEISNWARPGHESRHNLAYWQRRPYEAVGPGAHAFNGVVRRWNAANLGAYLEALAVGTPGTTLGTAPGTTPGTTPVTPPGGEEHLTPEVAAAERIILALRLDRGVPQAWAQVPPLAAVREWAETSGLLEAFLDAQTSDAPRLRLTTRGRLLSNELFRRLV